MTEKVRFLVSGVVQGVGFRPFCARLAREIGLKGHVKNTTSGVELELWGDTTGLESFLRRLERECPTAAYIHSISELERRQGAGETPVSFEILKSEARDVRRVLIPPDIATCGACLEDMKEAGNRRYRYPFTNCTLCGPRFTIIRDLPYDRAKTTMSRFSMCQACETEYRDPVDRRYHAQPNACSSCGPALWISDPEGNAQETGEKAIRLAVQLLKEGKILALKGLGGFHLACDPFLDPPLEALRERKRRPDRPFAIMARNVAIAEKHVFLTEKGRDCLSSSRCPIVLCPSRQGSGLSPLLNPGMDSLGVMLPYTPLHHLLMEDFEALVMTSANLSEEPIIADNTEAVDKLGNIVDGFLMHDRDICMRVDDSVVSVAGNRTFYIRRGRGVVPQPLFLKRPGPSILAAGGEMKSTFSVTHEGNLFPSQYLGDLKEMPATEYYREALRHFLSLYGMKPRHLVHDLHPLYLSTRICREILKEPEGVMEVQHHHAHLAACLFENRIEEAVVGLILDGTGYGTDGTVWGGEILYGDTAFFERLGHIQPFSLPGGERAVKEPWRTALSLVTEACGPGFAETWLSMNWPAKVAEMNALKIAIEAGVKTTSCGRLFDGVSSLLGLASRVSFDGQAPMQLEAAARGAGSLPFKVDSSASGIVIDWRPAVRMIMEEKESCEPGNVSAAFHGGLARALAEAAERASEIKGCRRVVLSGGVWQNRRLFSLTVAHLKRRRLEPVVHNLLSPNDECVSVGQAAIGQSYWAK
jgi:hydrogenase maturation protein HypF